MRALALVLVVVLVSGCSTELGSVKCAGDDNCATGTFCGSGGACVPLPACAGGAQLCGHACTSLDTDLGNCGRCGNACTQPAGGSATCSGGACRLACGANLIVSGSGCAFPAPGGLVASGGQGQVALHWTAVAGATGYAISRGPSATGAFTALGTSTTAAFTDTPVQPATTWFYVVHATGAAGLLVLDSTPVSALTTPAAPAHLVATGGGATIALAWDVTPGATGYTILHSGTAGGSFTAAATSTTNGWTDSGLTDGATWFYQILATNSSGASPPSAVASATTAPAPVTPTVTAPAFLTAGDSATATVPARAGMTYLWSLSGAGTIPNPSGVTSGGVNTVGFGADSVASGTLVLSCVEVNAAGHKSAAGTANVGAALVPTTPAITAPASVAPGATGTASVVARAGMTYAWTVTNATPATSGGVTANGLNTLTFTGGASGTVGLSCIETNAANKSSGAATASVPIFISYTLTVSGSGTGAGTITSTGLATNINCAWSGSATTGACSIALPAGTTVSLSAAASPGSRFAGWSNACTGGSCSFVLNANANASASFLVQTKVSVAVTGAGTVVSTPPGIDCGATCSAGFDATGSITLTAIPGGTATFVGFSGDCSATSTCTLPTDGVAKSVTATFTSINLWTGKQALPVANTAACSGVIAGVLYAAEGNTAPGTTRAYHPVGNSWTTGASPSAAQASVYSAGGVVNGLLYCAGGCGTSSDCRIANSSLLVAYDPTLDTWTTRAAMPAARAIITVAGLGGQLYRVGGIGACPPCTPTTSVEAYDPVGNTWTAKPPLPVARAQQALVALGGRLYSIGGSIDWSSATGKDSATPDVLVFDPAAPAGTAWTQLAPMANARLFPTCDALGGKIYCAGGSNYLAPVTTYPAPTEVYDPQTNLWTTLPNLPTPRTEAFGGTIGGLFYVVGGSTAAGPSAAVEVYTP